MKSYRFFTKQAICFVFSILLLLGGTGCGESKISSSKSNSSAPPRDPLELAQEDLSALSTFQEYGARHYDLFSNQRFSQIFGGTSGKDVRNFIDERIQHYLRDTDIQSIHNGQASNKDHQKWSKMPKKTNSSSIVASNIGTGLWWQGLIDDTDFSISLKNGNIIPVTSTRSGIMLFGKAYSEYLSASNGQKVKNPVAYRQALLIHEARHSDCSGGVTQSDIQLARQAQSYTEFFGNYKSKGCGHLHSLCKGGDFDGQPACDSESWGGYGIQLVFLEAARANTSLGSREWQILNAIVIDTRSRLQFDYLKIIHDSQNNPDLTSSGLK